MTAFEHDVVVIGAGRIGLPWAAVLAATQEKSVTCVDISEERVRDVNEANSPFAEPQLGELMETAVKEERLRATTRPEVITDHEYVAYTLNAPRNDMSGYLDIVESYAELLVDGQTVISRTTLPVGMVSKLRDIVDGTDADVNFTVFPERLAEGKAIEEIGTLPKVVGVDEEAGERTLYDLLEPFGCPIRVTDPETAMLVKLIDNSYRDALFAISNQIAYTADQLDLDAHEAIELANRDYPRNSIPRPGTVGGKCLPKDPHFLTDERVCDQPTTPDLFNFTRRTNAYLQSYVVTQLLRENPSEVAVLGLSYKRKVCDTFNSPAVAIKESLESHGVSTRGFDPYVEDYDGDLDRILRGVDGVLLAVNHPEFEGIEPVLNDVLPADGFVYDIWGALNPDELSITYNGFGITRLPTHTTIDVPMNL
jgi:UDP-N-acetyl-D-mannosaminuronic acid dehydrogenase